ncbi:(2Fe-2S) ferredoxin domain-containing protein [candidate division KSB1 bacterium]|nr:MAG: (2Fe-2S) ferredoxin domain-containing protein [candidate division KSB1 bacterium]
MPKLTLDELKALRDKAKESIKTRDGKGRAKIIVHMGTCGIASGARNIMNSLLKELEERNITDVIVTTSGCAGLCSHEPMMTVEIPGKPPVKYIDLTEDKVKKIMVEHILGGNIVVDYALAFGSETVY